MWALCSIQSDFADVDFEKKASEIFDKFLGDLPDYLKTLEEAGRLRARLSLKNNRRQTEKFVRFDSENVCLGKKQTEPVGALSQAYMEKTTSADRCIFGGHLELRWCPQELVPSIFQ